MTRLSSSISRYWSLPAATAIAAALLAVGAISASPSSAMAAGPPPAPPSVVEARLGVGPVRAEIVILVDISSSMSPSQNNLYPGVLSELRVILNGLASQEPQDTVVVAEFASAPDIEQIYEGPARGSTGAVTELPRNAADIGTNIGAAFQYAIGKLENPPAGVPVQAGGVLLLSDGQLWAPGDSDYGSYSDPGWRRLRTQAQHLPIKVEGYGLPLTTDKALINDVSTALRMAFGTPLVLASNTDDLSNELQTVEQQLLDSEVATAAAPDSGKGVQVSWSGLPRHALDMTSAGHLDATVTLTATTQRVPLYLTGLSVTSDGLPAISGTLPDQTLNPGQSIPLTVQLTWRRGSSGFSLFSGTRMVSGQLVLAGHVYSTYTQTIRYSFNDPAFSTGGMTDASSAQLTANTPVRWNFLIILIILVALILLLGTFVAIRSRLRLGGTFTLTFTLASGDDVSDVIPLSRWRSHRSVRIDKVTGVPGRMTVRGNLRDQRMQIWLQLKNQKTKKFEKTKKYELTPGGRTMIAGVDIVHHENSSGPGTGPG